VPVDPTCPLERLQYMLRTAVQCATDTESSAGAVQWNEGALPLIDVTEQAAKWRDGGSESRLQRPWYYS